MLKKHLIVFALFVATIIGVSCTKAQLGRSSAFNLPALKGTNAAGGDIDFTTLPATEGSNFIWISHQDIDYMATKKINFVRLIFSWEAMQPTLNGALNTTSSYATEMADRVNYLTNTKGIYVMIEPHGSIDSDFAAYKNVKVGSTGVPNTAFADFWSKMAALYKTNPRVLIGLTNEPHDMGTMQWFGAAQAAVTGIRGAGFTGTIMVPGNGWTGASTWTSTSVDTATPKVSNATGWLTLKDPLNNMVASVHMYLDANAGGGANDVVSATVGVDRLTGVVNWAKTNNVKIHLSEIGVDLQSNNPSAALGKTALTNLFSYIDANNTTVIGWSWWAYGPPEWWGGYQFALSPANVNSYGTDSAQMAFLAPFFTTAPVPPQPDASTPPVVTPPPVTSPTKPTNPIAFTKNAIFTTNSGQTNWVYVPNSYDSTHNTPTKLFVWLHGCGGQSQYDISMVSYMSNQDWISIAVGGRETTCWSVNSDTTLVLNAIADLQTHFNIDPKRIILGGYSSGGDLTYRVAFYNAQMFAGVLVENSSPFRDTGSSQAASLAAASWKFNTVQLSHTSDTTYPPSTVKVELAAMTNAGFPTTYIEKPGTHYDDDNGASGTSYDLRTFLLPHLADGWISGTAAPIPVCTYTYSAWGTCQSSGVQTRTTISSSPTPCTPGVQTISQACTYVPPVVPVCTYTYSTWGACQPSNVQSRTVTGTAPNPCTPGTQVLSQTCTYVPPVAVDTDGDGIMDTNDKCPKVKGIITTDGTSNGCPGLVVTATKTYDWGTGYCKQFYFKNNNSVPMSWKTMTIHLNDGKLRGTDSVWGGTFPNSSATGTIVVTPSQNTKVNPGQNSQTVGFCADYGSTKYVGTNGGLTY